MKIINKNIPNYLTIFRVAIIPMIILSFYFPDAVFAHQIAALLFIVASLSDFLDGYLARKYRIESNFGKIFDPIADKLLVASIIIMLVKFDKADIAPSLLILFREILVSGLREFLAGIKKDVPVSHLAQIKTTFQMAALFMLLLGSKGSGIEQLDLIAQTALWIAALLTIITGYSYLKICYKYFKI